MITPKELSEACERALGKMVADGERLEKALTIEKAIGDLIDTECLLCNAPLWLPTLENIQNWLEETEELPRSDTEFNHSIHDKHGW